MEQRTARLNFECLVSSGLALVPKLVNEAVVVAEASAFRAVHMGISFACATFQTLHPDLQIILRLALSLVPSEAMLQYPAILRVHLNQSKNGD